MLSSRPLLVPTRVAVEDSSALELFERLKKAGWNIAPRFVNWDLHREVEARTPIPGAGLHYSWQPWNPRRELVRVPSLSSPHIRRILQQHNLLDGHNAAFFEWLLNDPAAGVYSTIPCEAHCMQLAGESYVPLATIRGKSREITFRRSSLPWEFETTYIGFSPALTQPLRTARETLRPQPLD